MGLCPCLVCLPIHGHEALTCAVYAVIIPQTTGVVKTVATKIRKQSETKLERLHQDYQKLKQQIAELGFVVPGTLQKRSYSCGQPNCRCIIDGILHGPYNQWTRKIKGKTVNINLDREAAAIVHEWIQNNRKLKRLCTRLEKTSLEVLRTITDVRKT